MTIYAIGDIHGHLDQLRAAHDRVAADRAREGTETASLVHVGDLVDRGPDSAGVVALLASLAAHDPRVVVLKGNHDAMFSGFLEQGPDPARSRWLSDTMGGRETLLSYDVPPDLPEAERHAALLRAVPLQHRRFLAGRPTLHREGGYAFVHAGIRPGIALDAQKEEDLLWIRGPFLFDTRDHGALIVHGHTPVERVELHPNRLAIDTGTAWGGPLTAVAIEPDGGVFVLTDTGRFPVRPVTP
jgi:serine/threonine protein phosphatase 1